MDQAQAANETASPLEAALATFVADLRAVFGDGLVDVILFGSATLGDFTPGRGDIDYVVATEGDVSDADMGALFDLHDAYRARTRPGLEWQLEGAFYPRRLLSDPKAEGLGVYIGTGRKGWKRIHRVGHNAFDFYQFATNARRLLGSDLAVRRPTDAELLDRARRDHDMWSRVWTDEDCPSHVVVQWAARVYFFSATGRVGSKSESCALLLKRYPSLGYVEHCASVRAPYDEEAERAWPGREEATSLVLDLVRRDVIEPGLIKASY